MCKTIPKIKIHIVISIKFELFEFTYNKKLKQNCNMKSPEVDSVLIIRFKAKDSPPRLRC